MTGGDEIRVVAGQQFRWFGLPGQYDPEATVTIGSTTASMQVNARVDRDDGTRSLVTIGAADLIAAIEQGWLHPLVTAGSGGES